MHASTSSAATTAITIAPVERVSAEGLVRVACVSARDPDSADLKGVTLVGLAPDGVWVVVGVRAVPGVVVAVGLVVVGTVTLAGAVVAE